MFSNIYIILIIYIYVDKSFSTMFNKRFRKNIKKKKEEMEKLENLNSIKREHWIWNRKNETR